MRAEVGDPTVLVYNVGTSPGRAGILETKTADVEAALRSGALGAMWATQEVLPAMIARRSGTILYTSATAAFRGGAKNAPFAMGKFALRALAQSVAREHGPNGIHAVTVRIDGVINRPGVERFMGTIDKEKLIDPDEAANIYWSESQQLPYGGRSV